MRRSLSNRRRPVEARYKDMLVIQKPYSFQITVFDKAGAVLFEQRADKLYSPAKLRQIAKEIRDGISIN